MHRVLVLGFAFLWGGGELAFGRHGAADFWFGWGTEIEPLAAVAVDSEAARSFPGGHMTIAYKWDQLWFGLPFWVANRGYVIETQADQGRTQYLIAQEQDRERLATLAGVSSDQLSPPLFSRLPFGYLVLGLAYGLVKLMSGPGPRKRFQRLIQDPRYQQAMQRVYEKQAEIQASDSAAEPTQLTDAQAQTCFEHGIALLAEHRISRLTSERNLHFLLDYVQTHPEDVLNQATP